MINTSTGKSLVDKVLETGKKPGDIVRELGLGLVSDEGAIREVCRKIVDGNPKEVAAYRGGKETLIGWFVGQVMKEMRGKADPEMAKAILSELFCRRSPSPFQGTPASHPRLQSLPAC